MHEQKLEVLDGLKPSVYLLRVIGFTDEKTWHRIKIRFQILVARDAYGQSSTDREKMYLVGRYYDCPFHYGTDSQRKLTLNNISDLHRYITGHIPEREDECNVLAMLYNIFNVLNERSIVKANISNGYIRSFEDMVQF